jgi:hypothetical protein
VGDDPASDDLFDLLLSKETAREAPPRAVREMIAVRILYDRLTKAPPQSPTEFAVFCGLAEEAFELWGDHRLWRKVRLGMGETASVHVAAGSFLRTFLLPEGLLVSEDLLAVRLGVNREESPGWPAVIQAMIQARYAGVGAEGFNRWWAQGLQAYWRTLDEDEYLHERTAFERVMTLRKALARDDLHPFEPDARYWRLCALSRRQGEFRPIDPRRAVSLAQRTALEPWVEPEQAAADVAAMNRDDPRVDPEELARAVG